MYYISKLNPQIYRCITHDIVTTDVIITEEQIRHIKERHLDDFDNYSKYFREIISDPDYIIEANKENTAVVLKEIDDEDKKIQLVLRICTSQEPKGYKNSIITFMKIDDKRWKRYLRTKKILYKKE